MKQVRFEFEELPYETLSQFGLTQEMIEDLPMHILKNSATAGTRLYFPSR
jgi:hypothetical protein